MDAHHQNGKAEVQITRLQELTRSMLSHARRKWPQEITANLWPYALRMANDSINATPNMNDKQRQSPDQMFSGSEVTTMRQPDWPNFAETMEVEVEQQISQGVYSLCKLSDVPEGATILDAIWQLRRKRDVCTNDIKKYYKA